MGKNRDILQGYGRKNRDFLAMMEKNRDFWRMGKTDFFGRKGRKIGILVKLVGINRDFCKDGDKSGIFWQGWVKMGIICKAMGKKIGIFWARMAGNRFWQEWGKKGDFLEVWEQKGIFL